MSLAYDLLIACYQNADGDCPDSVLFQLNNPSREIKEKICEINTDFVDNEVRDYFNNCETISFTYDLREIELRSFTKEFVKLKSGYYKVKINPANTLRIFKMLVESNTVIGDACVENILEYLENDDENEE